MVMRKLISALVLLVVFPTFVHASDGKENWVMTYSFSDGVELPALYLEVVLNNDQISGVAKDDSEDLASLTGSVNQQSYQFTIHRFEMGNDTSQDIIFKGVRVGNQISGKWQHVVGVSGQWSAELTTLAPKEALKPYLKPCKELEASRSNNDKQTCKGHA
ncbi:hypothetical protein [Pontibacterium sp.]|uniref:hypothetical protein n=1 Tax=Pontibacterium sp. TaxID=2036026 RepID=UPI00356B0FE1